MLSSPTTLLGPEGGTAPERGRWMHLSLLSVVSVAEGMQGTVANVLFPAIRQSLGLRLDVFGLLQAVPQLAAALCGPAWSAVAQRTNRKAVFVICAVCGGIWAIAAGFAHDLEQLMCMYVLGAIFFSGGGPIMKSLLTDLFVAKVLGRAIGYLYGIVALSTSITAPAIGLLSRVPDGWRYGFFTAGTVCVVSGVLVAVFVRDPGVGAAEPELRGFKRAEREQYSRLTWEKTRELSNVPTVWLTFVMCLLNGEGLLLGIGVVYLVDVYHFDNSTAATVILPGGIGALIGTVGGGFIAYALAFLSWAFTALSSTINMKIALLMLIAGLFLCKAALITRLYRTVPKDAHNLQVTMELRAASMAHINFPAPTQ